MGVSSSIGPISGINYGQLITGLTQADQGQITAIGTRISGLDSQNTALLGLSALMTQLKVSAASFTNSSVFRATTATSANSGVVNATAGAGTPVGTYNFNVQQLAAASQVVTQGFSDAYNNPLGLTGNITLQLGGGQLDNVSSLATLNGGAGVARGSIRVTDGSGASTIIDLSHAVDAQDVVDTINSTTGVNVIAKIDGDHLDLSDNSGGTGNITISNVGGTTTATNLGIAGTSSTGTITGTSLTTLSSSSTLNSLNDGNGVRTAAQGNDFSITGGGGTVNVSLGSAKTIGDVVSAINTAGSADGLSAAISADGHGLTLTDSHGGPVAVAAQNGSFAAYDLGILGTSSGGSLVGSDVVGGLSGPLLRDLNGGNEGGNSTLPQPGTITINGQTIDLSGASTLDDVIKGINTNTQGVTATINNADDGITLTSSSGNFTVADGTGNLASFLKIAGTSTPTADGSQVNSGDLNLRYISNDTQLSTLNGGTGFKGGNFTLTVGSNSATVNLSGTSITTIGDVINAINNATAGTPASGNVTAIPPLGIVASINSTGDGIVLTQTGGTGQASIKEAQGGSTAASLGLSGTFTSGTLNGSFQKTISIDPKDKLSDIATKLNNANIGVSASIINDGSGTSPYRLSIASRNSGSAGNIVFDASGLTSNGAPAPLTTTTLVKGQNASIVYGGNANGTGGLLASNTSNTFSGLVPGLSVTLAGVGNSSITVTNDTSQISTAVQSFVTSYNAVVNNIATDTSFDSTNSANNGVLFGNSTVEQVQNALNSFVTQGYFNVGQFTSLSAVGISVNQDGTLALDTDTLNQALSTSTSDVQKLFTTNIPAVATDLTQTPPVLGSAAVLGIGITLSNMIDNFTDASTGILFDTSDAIQTQEQELTDQQTSLNTLLTAKKNLMIQQFANLEVSIAGFQQQGTALSSLSTSTTSSTA